MKNKFTHLIVYLLMICVSLTGTIFASQSNSEGLDLSSLSLEDLMDIEITSVSKKAEKLSDAAAAIYVLTGDEIRKSGARNIPDALRMVPGLHVASIDGSSWAISVRGFNGQYANKLLVLIDGRTIYTPLFSGVWWNVQDVPMENIDRIEIIRGSGATLWGANAVNGVINITTTKASRTQETTLSAGSGTYEQGSGGFIYNSPVGQSGSFRMYGKYFNRDNFVTPVGVNARDDWWMGRGGFRYDNPLSDNTNLTIQGDYYNGETWDTQRLPSFTAPYIFSIDVKNNLEGGNVLARYTHEYSTGNQNTLQVYADEYNRRSELGKFNQKTIDIDYQHNISVSEKLDVIWGMGYRSIKDVFKDASFFVISPEENNFNLGNLFAQVNYDLIPQKLKITLGSKVEYNTYTDFEVQPNVKFIWQAPNNQTIWGSVSRAVRTPSRAERDAKIFAGIMPPFALGDPLFKIEIRGNTENISETVFAYELGYRTSFSNKVSIDIASFYNQYDNLVSSTVGVPEMDENFPAYMIFPITLSNAFKAETYGAEFSGTWKPSADLDFKFNYSHFWINESYMDGTEVTTESNEPSNYFSLYSSAKLNKNIHATSRLRYVNEIKSTGVSSYLTGDLQLGLQVHPQVLLSITGQDLFENSHSEYITDNANVETKVERRFHADIKFTF